MELLDARINSFKKSKRVKNPSKPSSTTTLKWPHPQQFRANPDSLAEAGFYYDPSYDDPDNVTCYVCEKELGGWEEDDDPFLIHWTKCGQTCCWANVRCGLMSSDLDRKGRFITSDKTRIPTHKSMEKARYETFFTGKGWSHDKVPNHGANSKMMARAGFVYTPQSSGDDLATCFYCNTSLSGWDAEDDPLEEHRKRENKTSFPCPFFSISPIEIASSNKPISRAPSMKPSSKSQAKPPSRSASRSKHQDVVQPTKTFDGELEEDSDGFLRRETQTGAKTPRNARTAKKSSAKTPGNKTRSSSRTGLKHVAEEGEGEDEDETEAPAESQPPVEKKGRSRSKSVAKKAVTQPEPDEDEQETRKPSRSKSKKVVSDAEEEPVRKPSRSKSKAAVATEDEALPKKSRSKSKTKAVESEQEQIPQTTAKPKIAPRSKSKALVPDSDRESEQEAKPEILTVAPKKKAPAKSKTILPPAPQELFHDDVFTDQYVPPPVSLPPALEDAETSELPPLFIPKRNAAKKVPSEDASETVPTDKEKKRPGRPKNKPSQPPRSRQSEDEPLGGPSSLTEIGKPLAPVSTNPSTLSSQDKAVGKVKAGKQKMKVVEISSDEEPQEKETQVIPQQDKENSRTIPKSQPLAVPISQNQIIQPLPPKSTVPLAKREKKQVTVETMQPIPTPSPVPPADDPDVSMASVGPENDASSNEPVTPPRPVVKTPPQENVRRATTPEANAPAVEPLYTPALSKLPFTPLHALTEPELDMTVEEWIRYQMDVEFDKFRRDGERELQMFRKRAEEVRKIIEGL